MTMNDYLSSSIQAYTGALSVFPEDNGSSDTFYILNIISSEREKVSYTWDVKFSVDHSGSMSDNCNDGRTKMQHIKHVIANILRIFASDNYENMIINVCLHIFDDDDEEVIDFIRITKSNVLDLISKIEMISPNGSTDLLKPFQITQLQMANRALHYPESKRLHFMLTDGMDTCNNNSSSIVDSVSTDYSTVVFGFGMDHDYDTLMIIGSKPNVDYAFIDDLEKAGMVYGEYLHKLFHVSVEDMHIEIVSGEAYDWKTNMWSRE
jgi:hypothetical protein